MSAKQDAGYARTAQDLERKYKFGETFAEMLGLINDNRDKVDSVESSLTDKITEQSTSLKRDAAEIVASATKEMGESIEKVEAKLNSDVVSITVKRVKTEAGYVFDDNGINISKSGEEIKNLLDFKGMYVKRSGEDILRADKNGVAATDLHAKTYLIIGSGSGRSRFEDYDINRTACFWIGG